MVLISHTEEIVFSCGPAGAALLATEKFEFLANPRPLLVGEIFSNEKARQALR